LSRGRGREQEWHGLTAASMHRRDQRVAWRAGFQGEEQGDGSIPAGPVLQEGDRGGQHGMDNGSDGASDDVAGDTNGGRDRGGDGMMPSHYRCNAWGSDAVALENGHADGNGYRSDGWRLSHAEAIEALTSADVSPGEGLTRKPWHRRRRRAQDPGLTSAFDTHSTVNPSAFAHATRARVTESLGGVR